MNRGKIKQFKRVSNGRTGISGRHKKMIQRNEKLFVWLARNTQVILSGYGKRGLEEAGGQ